MRAESLQALSLTTAEARSLEAALGAIVRGLVVEPGIALARIWLLDNERTAPMLRLVASAGGSLDGRERWERLDGDFSRIPLGQRKVGVVAATGKAVLVADDAPNDPHIARPDWARKEQIRAFCGQPLLFRGQVLGVLAVFSRTPIDDDAAGWLRTFADHAAVSIANARAFDELERLRGELERERDELRAEMTASVASGPIVGESSALVDVLRRVDLVAPTDATVLILGESGTGKELVATAIHERSRRATKPIVRVNCAAVPADLFESEFFGHVRGAFTGALRERAGKLQLADGGTLFLDEIAEIPLSLQGKLLRTLQEQTFERVGEDRTRRVDVRFVAATNRDLESEVRAGRFREDLYFRLSVFPIEVPPLRERKDDIALLAKRFVDVACKRFGRAPLPLTAKDIALLESRDWPGNVRELMNVVERAVILSERGKLRVDAALKAASSPSPSSSVTASAPPRTRADGESSGLTTRPRGGRRYLTANEWRARERENLEAALEAADGQVWGKNGAAALLGMKPTTLASRLKALKIKRA